MQKTSYKSKSKYLILGSLLTTVILVGGISIATITQADENVNMWDILTDDQKDQIEIMKQEKQAEHEEMLAIIEEGDYAAWKEIIDSRPHITDYINEDNFDRFSEMHKLMQEGKIDQAQDIREELGLPDKGMGMGMGQGKGGMHKGMGQGRLQ